jgi:hypothetical protein
MFDWKTEGAKDLFTRDIVKAEKPGVLPDQLLGLPEGTKIINGRVVPPETGIGALTALLAMVAGSLGAALLIAQGVALAVVAVRSF